MGLFGFISALLGRKEKKRVPLLYQPPYAITPIKPKRPPDPDFWEQRRALIKKKLDDERKRRSKYGGF